MKRVYYKGEKEPLSDITWDREPPLQAPETLYGVSDFCCTDYYGNPIMDSNMEHDYIIVLFPNYLSAWEYYQEFKWEGVSLDTYDWYDHGMCYVAKKNLLYCEETE